MFSNRAFASTLFAKPNQTKPNQPTNQPTNQPSYQATKLPSYQATKLVSGRRTSFTKLAAQGISVFVLASLAGHRSISTTQRYVSVNDDMKRRAVELV